MNVPTSYTDLSMCFPDILGKVFGRFRYIQRPPHWGWGLGVGIWGGEQRAGFREHVNGEAWTSHQLYQWP